MDNNQQKFDELFKETFEGAYELVENYTGGWGGKPTNALNLELVSEKREDVSDSYDYTDDVLENVYYHKELDLYIKFTGTDVSYSGTTWNDNYTFVTPKQETLTTYE